MIFPAAERPIRPDQFPVKTEHSLKLDALVTRVYPLEAVNEAFAALGKGEVARSVLDLR